MTVDRTTAILLRLYPPQWRDRYGDELAAVIVAACGGKVPWRVRRNVAGAGLRERIRSMLGWSDRSPSDTISSALPTVLWAWLLVVVGGCAVAKIAEHWQAATPAASRALPAHAFDVLVGAAVAGTLIVLTGAALAVPTVVRGLRAGRGSGFGPPLVVALAATAAVVPATIGLAAWAHGLTTAQRDGHDALYGAAFGAWVALFVVCLAAWTRLGSRLARQAGLRSSLLRAEAWLAGAAATAMALITAATVVWWAVVADAAPWYFAGAPQGSAGTTVTWPLVVAALLMVGGTALAAAAAARALRASPALSTAGRR